MYVFKTIFKNSSEHWNKEKIRGMKKKKGLKNDKMWDKYQGDKILNRKGGIDAIYNLIERYKLTLRGAEGY